MLILSTLCLFVKITFGAYAEFTICGGEGAIYQPRWGQTEPIGNDLVLPYPVPGNPLVIKRGTHLGVKINWEGGPQCNHWQVANSKLYRENPYIVYWTEVGDPHGFHRANQTHCFPHPYPPAGVPNYVEKAYLQLEIISCQGVITPLTAVTPVYIVLDDPVQPMTIPWISVLDYSCEWARELSESNIVTDRLTYMFNLFSAYDPFNEYYTPVMNDQGEIFYLKSFINRSLTGTPWFQGQCNDFADFLLCLVNSVGAYEMKCHRTWSFASALGIYYSSGWMLKTEPIDPAGHLHPIGVFNFTYHQFPNVYLTNQWRVWDASFKNLFFGDCWNLDRESIYETLYLVYQFDYYHDWIYQYSVYPHSSPPWDPFPESGFVPTLTAEDIN